jgi:hypothetical protein
LKGVRCASLHFSCFGVFSCWCSWAPSHGVPIQARKGLNEALPSIIVSGLDAYKAKGPEDAVRAWIKGSPIDGSKDALSQANVLRQIHDCYGAYQGFEVFSRRELSPTARLLYLILDFEKGRFIEGSRFTERIKAGFSRLSTSTPKPRSFCLWFREGAIAWR